MITLHTHTISDHVTLFRQWLPSKKGVLIPSVSRYDSLATSATIAPLMCRLLVEARGLGRGGGRA